jgi:hypothetical protein
VSEHEPIRPLEQLRTELMRGASERPGIAQAWAPAASDQRRRLRRPKLGWAGLAIGTAVAIVVAVGTLALAGGHHTTDQSAARSTCTARLLDELGVLRRPQTASDRAFAPPSNPTSASGEAAVSGFPYELLPGLTRRARTLPGGSQVFLAAYAPKLTGPVAAIGDLVFVFIVDHPGQAPASGGEVSALLLDSSYRLPPQRIGGSLFSVVPDQVARVQWTFSRERLPRLAHAPAPIVLRGGTLTADVSGNIAAATALTHASLIPTITRWFNSRGDVINTFRLAPSRVAKSTSNSSTVQSQGTVVGTVSSTTSPCQPR